MNTDKIDPDNEFLYLSNDFVFYTLEGEGRYIGYPSVFLRTFHCNLTCKGFVSPDSPHGCDSYVSWSVRNKMSFRQVAEYMEERGYHNELRRGALLKLTGGEPLLWQSQLLRFVHFIRDRWNFADFSKPLTPPISPTLHVDFETNGTILPDEGWVHTGCIVTYTTSPKLSNNGDPVEKRFKPEVLRYLITHNACFKFVARQESDLDEVFREYINNPIVNLPYDLIWIMPMCGSRKELLEVGPAVAEICKKHGFKFSNRMHLQVWDKALKV